MCNVNNRAIFSSILSLMLWDIKWFVNLYEREIDFHFWESFFFYHKFWIPITYVQWSSPYILLVVYE